MTKEEIEICLALGGVRYLPATFDKRFGQNIASIAKREPGTEMTINQKEWMYRVLYKYRKQLPALHEKHKENPMCRRK